MPTAGMAAVDQTNCWEAAVDASAPSSPPRITLFHALLNHVICSLRSMPASVLRPFDGTASVF
ncbi:hypothetical protein NB688_001623 [Xanthomonas sacchari]|uniref:Uncharacterized protein n=1 Tax=Xanthomonas sacchari TaxID=56458 RepID=A0ABT3DS88_9XANT|nr:hypothetical protein CEK64_15090 [Xanthomonas sontii]MCW0398358.1 hypothetical protein [Xanthomonas sacchari]MCW0419457.1 hypothetical protein [Xanthomonas sacchari]